MKATDFEPLVSAYMGYYEITEEEARTRIEDNGVENRLAVYLEWNGIIGYTGSILRVVRAE